jgi:RNA polymerase sigma-B factor
VAGGGVTASAATTTSAAASCDGADGTVSSARAAGAAANVQQPAAIATRSTTELVGERFFTRLGKKIPRKEKSYTRKKVEEMLPFALQRRSIAAVTTVAFRGADERERLIVDHLPLVEAIAARYAHRGERREDLEQVGALALVGAVDRRDRARAGEFGGYAARCVDGEIRRHLRDRAAAIRLPRRVQEIDRQLRAARAELTAAFGREPTRAEVARAAGVPAADVASAAGAETARRPLELHDDDTVGDGRELPESAFVRALVRRAARGLDPRERQIVLLRFFLDRSQAEIGDELGLSQAHVSRLLGGAIGKLRRSLAKELVAG